MLQYTLAPTNNKAVLVSQKLKLMLRREQSGIETRQG